MKHYQYTNPKGQEVGFVEDNMYKTVRKMNRGEIFLKKRYFNGKLIDNAIAIDIPILEDLYKKRVPLMEATIIGVKEHSFRKYIPIETIMLKGEKICFDKRNKEGCNITGFNQQMVFSYEWGSDEMQEMLE